MKCWIFFAEQFEAFIAVGWVERHLVAAPDTARRAAGRQRRRRRRRRRYGALAQVADAAVRVGGRRGADAGIPQAPDAAHRRRQDQEATPALPQSK